MAEPFWLRNKRWDAFWAALTTLPLLWPPLPPLTDLPGHIARLRIAGAGAGSPLNDFYQYRFQWMGNLGLDLVVPPIARVIGLEPAVKLVMIAIVFATAKGMLAVARAVHGRVPPTALFALPLALGWPLIFGFANYAMAMAIALNGFALWVRMEQSGALSLRAAIFVPIGLMTWLAHGYGWGVLGLLAFAAELHRNDGSWLVRAFKAAAGCLPLLPPLIATTLWQAGESGVTSGWFDLTQKAQWLVMALRDRWQWLDLASVLALLLVLLAAARTRSFAPMLLTAAALLLLAFLCLPWVLFGSAYADMRLAPFALAIAVLAIPPGHGRALGLLAMLFFSVRIGANTISFLLEAQEQEAALGALDRVPRGARLVSIVVAPCGDVWHEPRLDHLPAMAIVRREAFANDQWSNPGAPMVTIRKSDAAGFAMEPSQIVTDDSCPREPWRTVSTALRDFPRSAFDYVWIIDSSAPDRAIALPDDFAQVWRHDGHTLYRLKRGV